MVSLDTLKNTTRPSKPRKRVGRGIGSKHGKTCGRGEKGAGSRSGYKRRYGKEGGNMPLFMKTPIRGFSNASFRIELDSVNLGQIDAAFKDGEVVNIQTLQERGFITGRSKGLKILGNGDITKKKLKIEANAISKGAREKLTLAKITFEIKE
ncbi:MAG: 50S ribosomal protein L15 [Parachlamydiaceae bacterium]|nr:50S ribosomal protein L15 [Parachlamydiaceae bacterium]